MPVNKQYPPQGVGQRLRRAMWDKDYDSVKLAGEIGMDRKSIYMYLDDYVPMTITTCVKICAVLNISPNYLLLGKES